MGRWKKICSCIVYYNDLMLLLPERDGPYHSDEISLLRLQ